LPLDYYLNLTRMFPGTSRHDTIKTFSKKGWRSHVTYVNFWALNANAIVPKRLLKLLRSLGGNNKKLSYRRETARQIRTSFSAHSLIAHFTEHRISCATIDKVVSTLSANKRSPYTWPMKLLDTIYFQGHLSLYH